MCFGADAKLKLGQGTGNRRSPRLATGTVPLEPVASLRTLRSGRACAAKATGTPLEPVAEDPLDGAPSIGDDLAVPPSVPASSEHNNAPSS